MRCPECGLAVATGPNCDVADTDCFDVTGAGTEADPRIVVPILSADVDQLLTCTASGFYATEPTSLSNPPACQVYHQQPQSIANNTLTTLAFNTEMYDTDTMHDNCVDEETEILTGRGWLRYDELQRFDEVLTLNHQSGLSEWQGLIDIHIHEARPRRMILMEGQNHSSLTTPDHRWPVLRRRFATEAGKKTLAGHERMFATTDSLVALDSIPIAARCGDLPTTAKWDDDFVELVGWFWTEGSIAKSHGQPCNTVVIMQSVKANPDNCERISSLLGRMFGPSVPRFGRQGSRHDGVPRWKVQPSARDCLAFTLNAPIAKLLRQVAPERVVSIPWLRELTSAQLELFIQVSLLGDGMVTPTSARIGQKSRRMAEAFQVAVLLSGKGSSLRKQSGYRSTSKIARFAEVEVPEMWFASQLNNTTFAPKFAAYNPSFSIRPVLHEGIVWCPETPNSTWLARRNGRIYFTGNSTNNGRITFTTAGIYIVTLNCTWKNTTAATGDRIAQIRKNATTILAYESKRAGGADLLHGHSICIEISVAAADYVEARVQQTSGSALNIIADSWSPVFSATRVA